MESQNDNVPPFTFVGMSCPFCEIKRGKSAVYSLAN